MGVLVAMSGGVDSSVAAFLMSEKYKNDCVGATMLLFLNETLNIPAYNKYPCCSRENIIDAKKICDTLGIKHEILNFMADFEEHVIKNFIDTYENGGTPNPCIACNKFLKFGLMLEHSEKLGLGNVATGHYAKIERDNSGRYLLRKAKDLHRDQSYVLYMLTQKILSRVEFPLGDMTKPEVRELAASLNFSNSQKHDSQDICFIPDGNYASFIENYTGKKYPEGNFVDPNGKILGTHKGIIHYTAGQRRGLGVSAATRLYVSEIDAVNNKIILVPEDDSNLYFKYITVEKANLIALDKIENYLKARVKIRYHQNEIPAKIFQTGESSFLIEFDTPQIAPAKGQSAVIYDDDYVIGGGIISQAKN